jgi:hypothetical protein
LREELAQLEKAGYHPDHPSPYYPADLLAAEVKAPTQSDTGLGGVASDSARSGGGRADALQSQSRYAHH